MHKEEKEILINKISKLKEHYLNQGTLYYADLAEGLNNALDFINDVPIEEYKETNLDHYFNELHDLIIYQGFTFASALELVYYKRTKKTFNGVDGLNWLVQPYEVMKKYKLTQFEYDLLETYDTKNATFTNYQIKNLMCLKRMKEKGYFKSIDEDMEVKEILENCEVIE